MKPDKLMACTGQLHGQLAGVGCPLGEQVTGMLVREGVDLLLCVLHPQPGGV